MRRKLLQAMLLKNYNLFFTRKHEQEFEVYQGEDQFVAHEFQMIDEASYESSILVIAGKGDKFSETLRDQRRPYNAKALSKKIIVRYIGTESQREYLAWVKSRRELFDFRIMPGLHTSSVSTSIHDGAVLFQVYGDPLLVFKLKSKQISKEYATFFESLWEICIA